MPFSILRKIKNEKLRNSIESIMIKVKEVHCTPFLYSFTDHGISHSKRMLQCINKLLEGCNQKSLLNEYECYVLIAAVYLHDIGIQESKESILKKFSKEYSISFPNDKEIPEFVRNNHHLISSYLVREDIKSKEKTLVYDGDVELGQFISLVIESHGIDFSKEVDVYKTYIYQDTSVRVHLLSVLLCLADAFDCDNRRIDSNRFKYTELPRISRIHWMKHLYVKGIAFDKRVITISYRFPSEILIEQKNIYEEYFCNETEYWLNNIRKKYLSILNDANLLFDLKHEIQYNNYIERLDLDDYSYIEEVLFDRITKSNKCSAYKKISIGLLVYEGHVLMVQRKNPENSLSSNQPEAILEWQFPAGVIKTKSTPEKSIIKEVLEETGIKSTIKNIIGKRLHPDTLTLCYYFLLKYESGEIKNGDDEENALVSWVPLSEYRDKITSNIYWKIEELLKEGINYE